MATLMAMFFLSIQIVEGSLMYLVITKIDTYIIHMDSSREGVGCLVTEEGVCSDA